jgi:hypothetical protein
MYSPEEKAKIEQEIGGELLADVGDEVAELRDFARKVLELTDQKDLPDELVQQGLGALVRLYTVKFQVGQRWPPFPERTPMQATAAMIMCTAILRTANVEVFELGMWQSWSGA